MPVSWSRVASRRSASSVSPSFSAYRSERSIIRGVISPFTKKSSAPAFIASMSTRSAVSAVRKTIGVMQPRATASWINSRPLRSPS